MCRPARIKARLVDTPRTRPPRRDHLCPMLAAFVADEDVLIAVLLDAISNLVEGPEDHVDIRPVCCSRDNKWNSLNFRLGGSLTIMLLQKLLGLKDSTRLLCANASPRSRCRNEGIARLDLVAFRCRLPHRLDGVHDLTQLHEARLCLLQSRLGDL